MNIFEQASRNKLRFESEKGMISTEVLWSFPVEKLNAMAVEVYNRLKQYSDTSFMRNTTKAVGQAADELRLEILKHIIAAKEQEADDRNEAAARRAKKAVLQEALLSKQTQAIQSMTKEEIEAELAKL